MKSEFQRANKYLVSLREPLNPQLVVIVNKITLHGASEAKICFLPLNALQRRAQRSKSAVYLCCESSAVIPPCEHTETLDEGTLFTLIDKCGKLLCLLHLASNKRFLIKTNKYDSKAYSFYSKIDWMLQNVGWKTTNSKNVINFEWISCTFPF